MATIARQYDPNISSLRPGQFECLADLIQQKSTIAIIPTEGGKSIIWLLLEIIARRGNHLQLLPPPLVVIIVPYKATIESHVKRYEAWGPCASSDESAETVRAKMAYCFFLYCTPEKIVRNLFFKTFIQSQAPRIRCIVFDEAHEWCDSVRV